MGFLSYNLHYYAEKVQQCEREASSESGVYAARQLLKLLDDLVDEEYFELYRQVEAQFSGVSRLKDLLAAAGREPFSMPARTPNQGAFGAPQALDVYLSGLRRRADACREAPDNPFFTDIARFCDWIGYDANTAYVFLLRDVLLPYLMYADAGGERLYPWLMGRHFLNMLAPGAHVDDVLRAVFFDALEAGYGEYATFAAYCKARIRTELKRFPAVLSAVSALLASVRARRILVVESGCYGTFPMLLAALDERVDIRMFTTVPYMADIYGGRVYTTAYEKNRLFETIFCQDALFRLAGFHDGAFYVEENTDTTVIEKAFGEIRRMRITMGQATMEM